MVSAILSDYPSGEQIIVLAVRGIFYNLGAEPERMKISCHLRLAGKRALARALQVKATVAFLLGLDKIDSRLR